MISTKLPKQSALMTVMTKAVIKASRGLIRDFSELENLQTSIKSNRTFVTSADMKANSILREELLTARPSYCLISEEQEEIIGEDKDNKWIVDPLDGTLNYMHGYPHWAISIALEREGDIVAAVTYDPILNELFWAEKGFGAYLNDRKIRVARKVNQNDLLIAMKLIGLGSRFPMDQLSCSIRRTGSTTIDMAYVAMGRLDMLIFSKACKLNKWDIAAGSLLIKEAGGMVSDKTGASVNNYTDMILGCHIDLMSTAVQLHSKIINS